MQALLVDALMRQIVSLWLPHSDERRDVVSVYKLRVAPHDERKVLDIGLSRVPTKIGFR